MEHLQPYVKVEPLNFQEIQLDQEIAGIGNQAERRRPANRHGIISENMGN